MILHAFNYQLGIGEDEYGQHRLIRSMRMEYRGNTDDPLGAGAGAGACMGSDGLGRLQELRWSARQTTRATLSPSQILRGISSQLVRAIIELVISI